MCIRDRRNIGKEHIYVWEPDDNMIHEDEAALRLARASIGQGIVTDQPNQGKVSLKASHQGLLKIDPERLYLSLIHI